MRLFSKPFLAGLGIVSAVAFSFQNCARTSFSEAPATEEKASLATSCASTDADRTENSQSKEEQSCPAGSSGKIVLTYDLTNVYQCRDGAFVLADTTKTLASTENSCTQNPPLTCSDGHNQGDVWTVNGTETSQTAACPSGQVGMITNYYQPQTTLTCTGGNVVTTSQKTVLSRSVSTCRPAYCTDTYSQELCDAYQYFFNRWPDQPGAAWWVDYLKTNNVPVACYKRMIANGAQPADCTAHFNKFGYYPNSYLCPESPRQDAPGAEPTAECP